MELMLALLGLLPAAETSRFGVIRQAADFTLTTQDGKQRRLADLRGKVVLVSFIFTTCNGSCPATTARLVQVQQRLSERGLLKHGQAHLLSISLDPVRDTPAALTRCMRLYDCDARSWDFLTGRQDQVEAVHRAWGMWTKPAPNGQLDHPSRVFLLDAKGRVREIYDVESVRPAWVVEDVDALLKER